MPPHLKPCPPTGRSPTRRAVVQLWPISRSSSRFTARMVSMIQRASDDDIPLCAAASPRAKSSRA
eukprot:9831677-Alexandrium_andersonii.AAC.1